ncbi:hypothetical protein GKQ38_04660 [Candidatus Nanohaloarchaea archaeon]|nr:hypothetical protein GKQ38_04660 [Candidatus Nanohaloarchaea archaeon]
MESKKDTVVTALVITLVISIPAAAQSIELDQGQNKFFKSDTQGKFGSSFQLDFSSARRSSYLKTPQYSVSSTTTPQKTVKTYSTAKADLTISYINATTRIEKITTPYGTLVTGVRNGRRFERFTGVNRTRVEKIKSEVKEKYHKSISELEKRETKAIRSELPDLKVGIKEGETEYVNITNQASEPVDLSGWKMVSTSSDLSDNFTVGQVTIRPGHTYTFYEGEGRRGELKTNAVYDTGLTIYSGSGRLKVYTDSGLTYADIHYYS